MMNLLYIATTDKTALSGHSRRRSGLLWPVLRLVTATTVLVVVATRLPQTATAFPTFPGGCPAGMSATTLGHAVLNPVPTFAQLGYNLLVNGQVVTAGASTTTLTVGQRYEIAVQATMAPFRGALIRVAGQGLLEAGQNAGLAQACTGTTIGGIGHVDRNEKNLLSGFFTATGGTSITLDVTVVEANVAAGRQVYSYQAYTLPVTTATAPVSAPTAAPTRLADRSTSFWAALAALWRQLSSFF